MHVSSSLCVPLLLFAASLSAQGQSTINSWLTTPDRSSLLAPQPLLHFAPEKSQPASAISIDIDDAKTLQGTDGFGFALTGGSAQLMMRMDAPHRAALIQEIFSSDGPNVGVSYIRVTIGSSDMNDHVYTYDDMPAGQQDPELRSFSLAEDRANVIPVLQQILAVAPKLKILATPWSAPAWMKTNKSMKGGSLNPEDYQVYAKYLVKYLKEMQFAGIPIDALTMQNEPLNTNNTPSMKVEADQEATFLKEALGPLLRTEKLRTKVILWDHNCDHPEYPLAILSDAQAAKYADGSGFHLYEGEITALSQLHNAYPAKNIYFTEQMVIDKPGATQLAIAEPERRIVIGALENWSRTVLLWNLAADPDNGPHTSNGGCPICEGAVTLDGNTVTRNLAYYTIAHVSRFVRPGAVRIGSLLSGSPDLLAQVALKTLEGKMVLLVANTSSAPQTFAIHFHGESASASLSAGAVATYVW